MTDTTWTGVQELWKRIGLLSADANGTPLDPKYVEELQVKTDALIRANLPGMEAAALRLHYGIGCRQQDIVKIAETLRITPFKAAKLIEDAQAILEARVCYQEHERMVPTL